MTFSEYEFHYNELDRDRTSILDTKYERVRCFTRGLRLPIYMFT